MDEDRSSEMDDFEEKYLRLDKAQRELDERRHRLQIEGEKRLQQVIEDYEIDREASQKDINQKRLALNKSKAVLETAIKREATRKRQHEAEVQSLSQKISYFKRSKQSGEETPSNKGKQKDRGSFRRPEQPTPALDEAAEDDIATEPQPGDHSVQNDPHYPSHLEEPSDGGLTACDGKMTGHGNGNAPSLQAQSQNLSLTKKTIAYDEVYKQAQDPNATRKHWIIEKSGNWYILHCTEHHLNWGKDPVKSAGLHLQSKSHGFSRRENLAVEELGELVEGCDREKAKMSNDEYQKALNQGYSPNNTMTKPRQGALAKPAIKSIQEPFDGVIDPVVGEIYHAWWDGDRKRGWYSVVILPYLGDGDWKEVGITGNLFSSGLQNDIPNCFKKTKVTKDSGEEALEWAEGYQDGGKKICQRKFPCLFLHPPLKVPSGDQEFKLGHNAEVLAFRAAKQLRHPSTVLPERLDMEGVLAWQNLARAFEARLRAIRGRQNPARMQETDYTVNSQVSSLQQHPNAIVSAENMESPQLPSVAGIPPHDSTDSNLPMSGDGSRDDSGRHGPATQGTGASFPSDLRKSASDQKFPLQMGAHGSAHGMAGFPNGSHAKLPDELRQFPGSYGNMENFGSTFQTLDRPRQAASVPASSYSHAHFAPRAAGPSALLPPRSKTMQSEELPEQHGMFRRGRSSDAVGQRDVMPNSAGRLPGHLPTQRRFENMGGTRRITDHE